MDAERCESCRFWRRLPGQWRPGRPESKDGHCRRYPPVRTGDPDEQTYRISDICDFAFTDQDEWCGEFSPATTSELLSPNGA